MRKLIAPLILIVIAGYAGSRLEAQRVQDSCDAENGPTIVNGTSYVCISLQHIRQAMGAPTA